MQNTVNSILSYILITNILYLANGTLKLDGSYAEGRPDIVRSRLPVAYRSDAPQPIRWLAFLEGLLYAEDISTLQEFIGYCLIPSNKGQRMMVIKGNGGEGKSRISGVLGALLGSNMKDGSIGKISENRFARADLEHILLCVDDDMRMEALRQTNYVKSIVTAQGKWIWRARASRAIRVGCLLACWHSPTAIFKLFMTAVMDFIADSLY